MACDVCGSHRVARREIEGRLLYECHLCGNLEGDDESIAFVEEIRAGRARGLDDEIIPLVSVLESAAVFQVVQASTGPPQILFSLKRNDTRYLERLLRSVEMANRETELRWLIELSLQHEIVYILRPRFWQPPSDITAREITLARADLPVLTRCLRRDLALSWWRD